MSTFRRYLLFFSAPIAGVALLVLAFNGLVDPFGLYRIYSKPGFNAVKVLEADHRRLIKAYRLRQVKPRGVILGTSLAEAGLDPQHPAWPESARPVYNAALPYANAYEIMRYLQHAVACGDVQEAVVGLDFVSFNAYLRNQPDFSESRLAADSNGHWTRPPVDERIALLLSWDAIRSSWKTVRGQAGAVPFLRTDGRQAGNRPPGGDPIGFHGRFLLIEAEYINYMWRHGPDRTFNLYDRVTGESYFDELRTMIATAREHGLRLHLVFSPMHARLLVAIQDLGWWEQFENWKRTVTEIVEEENARSGAPACDLLDFADFNTVTTEAVPPRDDLVSPMTGYIDSAHFSPATGKLVLDRVFGRALETGDFGVHLNSFILPVHLAAVRARGEDYRRSHENDVAEVASLVSMQRGDAMSGELDRLRAAIGKK